MPEAEHLTLAYLDGHPVEAAHAIDALPAEQTAALFATISPHLGGPVLAAMLPTAAARLLTRLDPPDAAALLNAAGAHAAVAVLRYVAEPERSQLIATLPPATGVATQLLLGFPDDSVAAWTDPDVVALAPALTVQAALTSLRTSEATVADSLYVVDQQHRLQGALSLALLLHAPDSTPIGQLALPAPAALAPMMPIASAADHPAWQESGALPVVNYDRRLLGVLRRSRLLQATRTRARPGHTAADASVTGLLAASYWAVVSGLAGSALMLLPAVKRVRPDPQ